MIYYCKICFAEYGERFYFLDNTCPKCGRKIFSRPEKREIGEAPYFLDNQEKKPGKGFSFLSPEKEKKQLWFDANFSIPKKIKKVINKTIGG